MTYIPEWESIKKHTVPQWYQDDKIGIFIHWGPYSVPAWAPPTGELGAIEENVWFCNNPYSEWYWNSVRVGKGPTYEHHIKTYGKDFAYDNFIDMWNAENWNPKEWAKLFQKSGAKYVVPVTKHHDGFCLWDSAFTQHNSCNRGPKRDIVDELSKAVRENDMRFGVYYSGTIDWRFTKRPMYTHYDVLHPDCIGYDYSDYAYNQTLELIEKYKPSVLWNDIGWPYKGEVDLPYLFSYYYNTVEDGVTNDRWNNIWHDYTCKEYQQGSKNVNSKWECCRGLGLSFAYNQIEGEEHILSPNALISLMIDTVAYNGNLLINVGPKADGTIPESQERPLLAMGSWLAQNGAAIYGTRPYSKQEEPGQQGETLFYTQNASSIFIMIDHPAAGDSTVVAKGMAAFADKARALGSISMRFEQQGDDLLIHVKNIPAESPAIALQLDK